jgi:PPM family protein phosphatase
VSRIGAVSDRGRAREENQDRYLAKTVRGVTLLAVADGVGGEAGGEIASAAAVDALAGAFDFGARDGAGALAAAMRATNDAVVRATGEGGSPFAASTLVAAAVRGRQVAVANLGDSRAYVVRGRAARQVTSDHSGEQTHSITRFVGDPRGVSPDVFIETLAARDRLVLCSDGLTRHVAPEEIAAHAQQPPEKAARALVDLANERGGQDNITVVVYAGAPSRLVPLLAGATLIAAVTAAAAAWALTSFPQTSCCMPPASPSATASPVPSPSAPASASPAATP